jgi:hypothetical protein
LLSKVNGAEAFLIEIIIRILAMFYGTIPDDDYFLNTVLDYPDLQFRRRDLLGTILHILNKACKKPAYFILFIDDADNLLRVYKKESWDYYSMVRSDLLVHFSQCTENINYGLVLTASDPFLFQKHNIWLDRPIINLIVPEKLTN